MFTLMPPGKVITIDACRGAAIRGTDKSPVTSIGLVSGTSSINADGLYPDDLFLRTQYSKALLDIPMVEANSRKVFPLCLHSSTLANIAADLAVFMASIFGIKGKPATMDGQDVVRRVDTFQFFEKVFIVNLGGSDFNKPPYRLNSIDEHMNL